MSQNNNNYFNWLQQAQRELQQQQQQQQRERELAAAAAAAQMRAHEEAQAAQRERDLAAAAAQAQAQLISQEEREFAAAAVDREAHVMRAHEDEAHLAWRERELIQAEVRRQQQQQQQQLGQQGGGQQGQQMPENVGGYGGMGQNPMMQMFHQQQPQQERLLARGAAAANAAASSLSQAQAQQAATIATDSTAAAPAASRTTQQDSSHSQDYHSPHSPDSDVFVSQLHGVTGQEVDAFVSNAVVREETTATAGDEAPPPPPSPPATANAPAGHHAEAQTAASAGTATVDFTSDRFFEPDDDLKLPDEYPDGFPEGWLKEIVERRQTQQPTTDVEATSGRAPGKDSYWYTPKRKIRLRSLPEVRRFLLALKRTANGDDEKEARKLMKKDKGKGNKNVQSLKSPPPPAADGAADGGDGQNLLSSSTTASPFSSAAAAETTATKKTSATTTTIVATPGQQHQQLKEKKKRRSRRSKDQHQQLKEKKKRRSRRSKDYSGDPFLVLSDKVREFLRDELAIDTAEQFLSMRTADVARSYVEHRRSRGMAELKGKSSPSAIVSGWRALVRKAAAAEITKGDDVGGGDEPAAAAAATATTDISADAQAEPATASHPQVATVVGGAATVITASTASASALVAQKQQQPPFLLPPGAENNTGLFQQLMAEVTALRQRVNVLEAERTQLQSGGGSRGSSSSAKKKERVAAAASSSSLTPLKRGPPANNLRNASAKRARDILRTDTLSLKNLTPRRAKKDAVKALTTNIPALAASRAERAKKRRRRSAEEVEDGDDSDDEEEDRKPAAKKKEKKLPPGLSHLKEIDLKEPPEPGYVCGQKAYYSAIENETVQDVASKIGLSDWNDLANIAENYKLYGPLKGHYKLKEHTLLRIPTSSCSKSKLQKLLPKSLIPKKKLPGLNYLPEFDLDEPPEPGSICARKAYYAALEDESVQDVAEKVGLKDWKDLAKVAENHELYGELKGYYKLKEHTLLRIPTSSCSKSKLQKVPMSPSATSKKRKVTYDTGSTRPPAGSPSKKKTNKKQTTNTPRTKLPGLNYLPEFDLDELPEPGSVCAQKAYYAALEDESVQDVADKVGLSDWKDLAKVAENHKLYGELKGYYKLKEHTLLRIPTSSCSKSKLQKLPMSVSATRKKQKVTASPSRKKDAHPVQSGMLEPDDDLNLPDEYPEGFPRGWRKEVVERAPGSKKANDSYWYSPLNQIKFRSMVDVRKFMLALKRTNGDENEAKKLMKVINLTDSATVAYRGSAFYPGVWEALGYKSAE